MGEKNERFFKFGTWAMSLREKNISIFLWISWDSCRIQIDQRPFCIKISKYFIIKLYINLFKRRKFPLNSSTKKCKRSKSKHNFLTPLNYNPSKRHFTLKRPTVKPDDFHRRKLACYGVTFPPANTHTHILECFPPKAGSFRDDNSFLSWRLIDPRKCRPNN